MPIEDEPPIREFEDRGLLWLLESPTNMQALMELVDPQIAARLDFSRAHTDKRSLVPDNLMKIEADILYEAPFRKEGELALVYVLLEHQSEPDIRMGLRLLGYMVEIWKRQERAYEDSRVPRSQWKLHPIIPIVLYTGRRRWSRPISVAAMMNLPKSLGVFVPSHETLLLELSQTAPERLMSSAVGMALRMLQAAEEPLEALREVMRLVARGLDELPESARPEWKRAWWYIVLLVLNKRRPPESERLLAVVESEIREANRSEVAAVMMTAAQELEERGRVRGKAEGKVELLLRQIEARFGPLPARSRSHLEALTQSEIDDISVRLLTASSLEELGL